MRHLGNAKLFLPRPSGAILVLQRSTEGLRPGQWDLPGGVPERHEKPRDAVRRETFEETGIRLARTAVRQICSITTEESPDGTEELAIVRRRFFAAEPALYVVGGLSSEHRGFEWMMPDKAAEELPPPHAQALRIYLENQQDMVA